MLSQKIISNIEAKAFSLSSKAVWHRRNLHRIPETGWNEVKTTAYLCDQLSELGYTLITGTAVAGHNTGVIAELNCGNDLIIALRFDIDALPITECCESSHNPVANQFQSINKNAMHACGHDGHMAIGLICAELLANMKSSLHGTIRFIFQPAEEGCRGACQVVARHWLDDVDYFISGHIVGREYGQTETGPSDCVTGVNGSLATTKIDASFSGHSCHGAHPESGASAISALCSAVIGLNSIPRNSKGSTLINIGKIEGGEGRNIIAGHASMELEVRGDTTELNDYMEEKALHIISTSAELYNCCTDIVISGKAPSVNSSADFQDHISKLIRSMSTVHSSSVPERFRASEDAALMINTVRNHGGKAVFLLFPTETTAPLHSSNYDFKEDILAKAVAVYTIITVDLLTS